jgi:branched-chain amino acid transport system ATP-binding protein
MCWSRIVLTIGSIPLSQPSISAQGVTILLVEQNAKLALEAAQRGYVLESGAITLSGAASELLGSDAVQRAYLGA